MDKKAIITIAGTLGSGKSSTANRVAEQLGFTRASAGDFMREVAEERGISLEELGSKAETDPTIDKAIDDKNREAGQKENIVVDGRLAFHFIPHSFKVYLTVDIEVAAARILEQIQEKGRVGQTGSSIEELVEKTKQRYANEQRRYMEYYGIDSTDLSPFDLIIDTKTTSLEEVVSEVVSKYNEWISTP